MAQLGLQLRAEGVGLARVRHQEDFYLGRGDVVDGKDRPLGQPILQITEETAGFEIGIATQFGSQVRELHVVSGRGTDIAGEDGHEGGSLGEPEDLQFSASNGIGQVGQELVKSSHGTNLSSKKWPARGCWPW